MPKQDNKSTMLHAEDLDLTSFIRRHQLPADYGGMVARWFLPLAQELARAVQRDELKILGIVGSQGSGKSTLADLLRCALLQCGLRVAVLSLDDFYFGRARRQALAREIHPLLATRGVPGTHDLALADEIFDALLTRRAPIALPRFDKAGDDRLPARQWQQVEAPVDLIIFEGWCLGARPESEEQLAEPINSLEAQSDHDGSWRRYVNEQLAGDYAALFARIDRLIFLKAPNFDCVYNWRRQQERKIPVAAGRHIMDDAQLMHFIQHYERITRHCLKELPAQADLVFELDAGQNVIAREGSISRD